MRRKQAPKRDILPDRKYASVKVEKFINKMMYDGKKSLAARIVYTALEEASKKVSESCVLTFFEKVLKQATPKTDVVHRRRGGSTYAVPVSLTEDQGIARAMSMFVKLSRDKARNKSNITETLADIFVDTFNGSGVVINSKDNLHKLAADNAAFSGFRW